MSNILASNWEAISTTSLTDDINQLSSNFSTVLNDGEATYSHRTNTSLTGNYYDLSKPYTIVVTGNHFTDSNPKVEFDSMLFTSISDSILINTNITLNAYTGKFSGYISEMIYSNTDGELLDMSGKLFLTGNGDFKGGTIKHLEITTSNSSLVIDGNMSFNKNGYISSGKITDFSLQDNAGHSLIANDLSMSLKTFDKLTDPNLGNTDLSNLYSYLTKGNDTFKGTTGADTMKAGKGNDTYLVDNAGDIVTENANEGTDTVKSSITYTLGDNIENLVLTDGTKTGGTANINGIGNALKNSIIGNAGDNVLDGAGGVDKLKGGLGDDTYIVDLVQKGSKPSNYKVKLEDSFSEAKNAGVDTLELRGNFDHIKPTKITLKNHLENLDASQTGLTKLNLNGNTLANTITGNVADNTINASSGDDTILGGAGNDTLIGGKGVDSLIGGTGDDTYIVDNASDSVTEVAVEGNDTVKIGINTKGGTYTLGDNIEIGKLINKVDFSLIGNAEDNLLVGNAKANTLVGGDISNDWLDGGKGADIMNGGTGFNIFVVDNKGDEVIGLGTVVSSASFDMSTNGQDATSLLLGKVNGNNMEGAGNPEAVYTKLNINGTGNSLDNIMTGTNGKNKIDGGAGSDSILGQGGNDTLTGGADNDTFGFGAGEFFRVPRVEKFGKDIITDFNLSEDTLFFGFSQFGASQDNHYDFITNTSKGVTSTTLRVSLDGGFTNGDYSAKEEDGRVTLVGVDLFTEFSVAIGDDAELYAAMTGNGNIGEGVFGATPT